MPGDFSGSSLATGDFNGDGHTDLAILSYGARPLGGARRGMVDLIWGPLADGALLTLANSPGTKLFGTLYELDALSNLSTGDLNADGFDDLIWGQPFDRLGDGKVTVVLGRPAFPDTMDLATGPPGVIMVLGVAYLGTDLGWNTCACDMDGDGYDDLIAANVGEAVVVRGSNVMSSVYHVEQIYGDLTHVVEVAENIAVGRGLTCADFDSDGRDDLVLGDGGSEGNPLDPTDDRPGLVRILYGHNAWRDTVYVIDPAFRAITLLPPHPRALYGLDVAASPLGQNIYISDSIADPLGCYNCGEIYRTFLVIDLPDEQVVNAEGVAQTVLIGSGSDAIYGWNLATGDFNRDELIDLAVVTSDDLDQTIIVYGSAAVSDSVFLGTDTTVTRILARDVGGYLGRGITVADLNGDGTDDLALGEPKIPACGRTYIIFGSRTTTAVVVSSFAARSEAGGVSLIWSVAADGEVLGWHVDRSDGGAFVRLTTSPLAASARSYDDATARFDTEYTYHLVAVTNQGEQVAAIATARRPEPALALYQNVPNPFNPTTTIRFSLPRDTRAVLSVFAVDGSEVVRLIDEKRPAGLNEVHWDGRDSAGRPMASGVYFCRLEATGETLARKLVLVR